jgi:prepilin-type N-terminal cleavage/methylation domain-containing protein
MTFFPDQKGFTLIELIIVIVILGILGAAGALGLKQAMDGYNLAKANSTSTQKAQNALDRIVIELAHITYSGSYYNISTGGTNIITYNANFGGTDETSTIQLSGTQVLLKNNLLIDNVTGLQFSYLDGNGTDLGASVANNASLRLIQVALTVQVISGVTRLYTARVALQQ